MSRAHTHKEQHSEIPYGADAKEQIMLYYVTCLIRSREFSHLDSNEIFTTLNGALAELKIDYRRLLIENFAALEEQYSAALGELKKKRDNVARVLGQPSGQAMRADMREEMELEDALDASKIEELEAQLAAAHVLRAAQQVINRAQSAMMGKS